MGFYLFDHPNPNAPVRSNGIRFWGYPQRTSPVTVIVLHTAENAPDLVGVDGGAEAVADFQTRVERPSSYHLLGDSDSQVPLLPDDAVAFGARGANAHGLHLSFATRAAEWGRLPVDRRTAMLDRMARIVAAKAATHRIPLVRLTRAQWLAGARGIIAHADIDPTRRSDPGVGFPWPAWLDQARRHLQEDEMPLTPRQEAALEFVAKIRDDLELGMDPPSSHAFARTLVDDFRKRRAGQMPTSLAEVVAAVLAELGRRGLVATRADVERAAVDAIVARLKGG